MLLVIPFVANLTNSDYFERRMMTERQLVAAFRRSAWGEYGLGEVVAQGGILGALGLQADPQRPIDVIVRAWVEYIDPANYVHVVTNCSSRESQGCIHPERDPAYEGRGCKCVGWEGEAPCTETEFIHCSQITDEMQCGGVLGQAGPRCVWFDPDVCNANYRGGCRDSGSCFLTGGKWCPNCHELDMRARWCHQCPPTDPWAYRPSRCVDVCSVEALNPVTSTCDTNQQCNKECAEKLVGCNLGVATLDGERACQAGAWAFCSPSRVLLLAVFLFAVLPSRLSD